MNMNPDWHPVKFMRIWFQIIQMLLLTGIGERESVESANLHVNSEKDE